MPLVQYIQDVSALDAFDITLNADPATNNALVLLLGLDAEETITATYNSDAFVTVANSGIGRTLAILILRNITTAGAVINVTRDASGDSAYTLYEVSGLAADDSNDASADNAPHGADDSPTVSLTPVGVPSFVAAAFSYTTTSISSYDTGDFKLLDPIGHDDEFIATGFAEPLTTDGLTYAATLSGADYWIAVIASFAFAPEETLLATMTETSESVALPATLNGFTGTELARAFRGADNKLTVRVRGELLNPDLVGYYDIKGMLADGQVSWTTDAAIKGAAQLKFVETLRDSQHSAPLGTFAATISARNPLFWLRLGEASGNAADSSGNARTFTANGTITYGIGSLAKGDLLNNAVQPNGTTGYFSRTDEAAWDVGTITISLGWSGTGVSQTLVDRDDGSGNRFFRLEVDANGLLSFAISFTTGSPTRKLFVASIKVNDGQPHWFDAVYDKSYVSLYVDGGRVLHTAETRTVATGTLGINIARNLAATNFSSGTFDEVVIVGRALTPLELLSGYQAWSAQQNELLFDFYRAHRVKVYYAFRMPRNGTDGTPWAEYAQGVYILPTLSRSMSADEVLEDAVSCQDQTAVLNDDKFDARYTVALGTNFVTAVLAIAQSSGFNTSAWAVTVTTKATTADIDFEQGSSKLEAINYLLTQIVYAPLRFNADGAGVIEPNVLDINRPVAMTFVADNTSVILVEGLGEEIELRKVPTEVLVTTGNPDTPDLLGSYKLNATYQIIYGSGTIAIVPGDPPDQATADAMAQQAANDKLAKFARRFHMITYPYPIHDDRDKAHVTAPQMKRDEDFIVEEWVLSLNPSGKMSYSLLSVVDVR